MEVHVAAESVATIQVRGPDVPRDIFPELTVLHLWRDAFVGQIRVGRQRRAEPLSKLYIIYSSAGRSPAKN